MTPPLELAFHALDRLRGDGLTASLAKLQRNIEGSVGNSSQAYLEDAEAILIGALAVKSAAAQIDNMVHAAGMLALLPKILEEGERVAEVCLAAGTGGRRFDLLTDRRAAEFKFMRFRDSRNSKRLEYTFGDFLKLAEDDDAPARRELWLIDPVPFTKFLNGRSDFVRWAHLANPTIAAAISGGELRWNTVADYTRDRGHRVTIRPISPVLPRAFDTPAPDE